MVRADPNEVRRVAEEARDRVAGLDLDALRAAGVARRTDDYNLVVHYLPSELLQAELPEDVRAALAAPVDDVAVYLHIPPCTGQCTFCHYTIVVNPDADVLDRYLDALKAELRVKAPLWRSVSSVLVGGGTPTYLTAAQLADLLGQLRDVADIPPGAEYTVESSPETLTDDKLEALLQAGFNRLNTGIQSFQGPMLKALGRRHDADGAFAAVARARAAGVPNINVDLMYALPGQSLEAWVADVLVAASQRPESITTYHLRKRPDTKISRFESPEEHLNLTMRVAAVHALEAAGYRESLPDYFCLAGRETAMAQARDKWRDMAATDGTGLGASSRRRDVVAKNVEDLGRYCELVEAGELPFGGGRALTVDDQMRQRVMFALKVLDDDGGARRDVFEREMGRSIDDAFGEAIDELTTAGLLVDDGAALRLSWTGRLFADEVCERFYTDAMRAHIRENLSVRDIPKQAPRHTA